MGAPGSGIRTVTATVKDGRVSFNQVAYEDGEDPPSGVLLAGWDQETGVYLWLRGYDDVVRNSKVQARNYSKGVGKFSIDDPPAWLGQPTFLSKDLFDPWENVGDLSTNAKRAAIIKALNTVLAL